MKRRVGKGANSRQEGKDAFDNDDNSCGGALVDRSVTCLMSSHGPWCPLIYACYMCRRVVSLAHGRALLSGHRSTRRAPHSSPVTNERMRTKNIPTGAKHGSECRVADPMTRCFADGGPTARPPLLLLLLLAIRATATNEVPTDLVALFPSTPVERHSSERIGKRTKASIVSSTGENVVGHKYCFGLLKGAKEERMNT